MDEALANTIYFSYLPPFTIDSAHMLLLLLGWASLIVSLIITFIRTPDPKLEERYDRIEHTLVTKHASSPSDFRGKEHAKEQQECTICQTPFQPNDIVSWSPNAQCCHVYHHMCIKKRLLERTECPSCRHAFDKCVAESSTRDSYYFCVRDGLKRTTRINDERARGVLTKELKLHRDYSSIAVEKDRDGPWDSEELSQSYGRAMRMPSR